MHFRIVRGPPTPGSQRDAPFQGNRRLCLSAPLKSPVVILSAAKDQCARSRQKWILRSAADERPGFVILSASEESMMSDSPKVMDAQTVASLGIFASLRMTGFGIPFGCGSHAAVGNMRAARTYFGAPISAYFTREREMSGIEPVRSECHSRKEGRAILTKCVAGKIAAILLRPAKGFHGRSLVVRTDKVAFAG